MSTPPRRLRDRRSRLARIALYLAIVVLYVLRAYAV
jgi:hypothetical protein